MGGTGESPLGSSPEEEARREPALAAQTAAPPKEGPEAPEVEARRDDEASMEAPPEREVSLEARPETARRTDMVKAEESRAGWCSGA